MPSQSLQRWNDERIRALDEIADAHASVGGSERGRRYATQQINYAYAAMLSSQFQGFCRDLHSESIDYLVTIVPAALQDALHPLWNWLLDRLESQRQWADPQQHDPVFQSVAQLADKASGDHEFLEVAAIYRGRHDFDVAAL